MAPLMELGKLAPCHPCRLQTKPASSFHRMSPAQVSAEGRVTAHSGRRGSNLLSENSSSSSESPNTGHSEAIRRQLAATAACLVLAAGCAPAGAYNVRLQDVENKTMQAGPKGFRHLLLAIECVNMRLWLVGTTSKKGVQAATEQRWEDAERFFQIVLKDEPESASAYSNMGNVHLSQRRPEQAVTDFSRAIQLAPEAPVPYLNRAIAEEQLGVNAASAGKNDEAAQHYQAAIQDCRDAQSRDSKEFAAFFNEGNVQARMGQFSSALAAYSRAADLAPGIAGYRLRQAELLFQNDRAHDADVMMRGIVRKSPTYAEAHAALAAVEWASGQKGLAEDHFDKAVNLDARWSKIGYIRQQTRWPPALYSAMERFLSIASVDDDRITAY